MEKKEMKFVDLGLSVKWATCNVGATCPEEPGDFFAWGETSPKEDYFWNNYKYSLNDEGSKFSKYVLTEKFGDLDHKNILEKSDDAASVNWGGSWRMPTDEELEDLQDKCTWTWTTLNGVNGYNIEGPNGNSIFLPAAGLRIESSLYEAGSSGSYWSSFLNFYPCDMARGISFFSDEINMCSSERQGGFSIRPVCD